MRELPRPMFGISVTPNAADYDRIVDEVLAADRAGLHVVGIQDHPYQRRYLDTYALIADLLARTNSLHFFADVTSLPMRPAPMIAKAAASMDVMSGGRFEVGLGAGGFWEAVGGMGGTVREKGERLPALEEAVDVIRQALDVGAERGVVRSDGAHYPVRYPPGPPTEHRVEIWIGADSAGALRLIGRQADGWVPGGGISNAAKFPAQNARIDDAADAAGRDPRQIRRIANVWGMGLGDRSEAIDTLSSLIADNGMDGIVYWTDEGAADVERFANEIVPALTSVT
jgi:alkanesulfonate monooxygenase SsuD/methylene tetrahydromethanopterin reductase-like flavin-dependent oxidoreductase (luciferase family)